MQGDVGPEFPVELLYRQIYMELAKTAEHHLFGLCVARKCQRRIFFNQLMQAETHFLNLRL